MENSPKFKLNKVDLKKIGTGFLIAFGGFVLTYTTELLPLINWGEYREIVMVMAMAFINLGRKWLKS